MCACVVVGVVGAPQVEEDSEEEEAAAPAPAAAAAAAGAGAGGGGASAGASGASKAKEEDKYAGEMEEKYLVEKLGYIVSVWQQQQQQYPLCL